LDFQDFEIGREGHGGRNQDNMDCDSRSDCRCACG
jgi:hypothetical protein